MAIEILEALPGFDGCVWPMDTECMSEAWEELDEFGRQRAVSLASAALSRLTAYRVSNCPIIARPAPRSRSCAVLDGSSLGGFVPALFMGQWVNTAINGYSGVKELELPPPVVKNDDFEVKIDGVVQDPDDFVVYNRQTVTYVGDDEDFAWPQSQDFTKRDTEEGTFSVTYLNAHPVDAVGATAAGLMAMEFAKACGVDPKKCRFPANVTQIVRQGLSIEVIGGAFPKGLTGIREVDSYVAQWNVNGRGRTMIFDPQAPDHRVQTS